MRGMEERIALVKARTRALARRRERKRLLGLSAVSICLTAALLDAIVRLGGAGHSLSAGELAGSSLLADSAGGYVLVAVLSFAAAVVVTTLCFRLRRRQETESNQDQKDQKDQKNQTDQKEEEQI